MLSPLVFSINLLDFNPSLKDSSFFKKTLIVLMFIKHIQKNLIFY